MATVRNNENSTTLELAGGAQFTGTAVDVSNYSSVRVYVYAVGGGGTLNIQQSADGTTFNISDTYAISDGVVFRRSLILYARFVRCVYTNGGVTQTTFELQTRFSTDPATDSANGTGAVAGTDVYVDDADWTAATSSHSLVGGVYQSTPGAITDGDTGPLRVNANGAAHIEQTNVGIDSAVNTNIALAEVAYSFHTGTAEGGGPSAITLASGASTTNDRSNFVVEIVGGTGLGQVRLITYYAMNLGPTATVGDPWATIPDATSIYIIHRSSGIAQSSTINTITLSAATAKSNDDFYNRCYIKILGGSGAGQLREIIDYTGATKVAALNQPWDSLPDSTSLYAVFMEGGTAGSGSSTTIVLDGFQTIVAADAPGLYVEIYGGTGTGQIRKIDSLSTNTLTVTAAWSTAPDSTSKYLIWGGWGGSYETSVDYSMVTTSAFLNSDLGERGIVSMQLSVDATGTITREKFVETGFARSAVHSLTITAPYYRSRFISMGTALGIAGKSAGVVTTLHKSKSKHLTSYAGEAVTANNDVEAVKAIVAGVDGSGVFHNVGISTDRKLKVDINQATYGESVMANLTPVVQLSYKYGIGFQVSTFEIGATAAVTAGTSMILVSTGSTAGTTAILGSKQLIRSGVGQGVDVRFDAIFAAGVAGTTQIIGAGDEENGFFFGYNGAAFGTLRRNSGKAEVQTLTITAGAGSGSGNITITLNGVGKTVAVAQNDTVGRVGRLIADTDWADTGGGWRALYVGNTVVFIALTAETRSGTYSYADAGTATGVAATIAQSVTAAAPTDTWTAQSQWNLDRADGLKNLPGLVHRNGNVYKIQYKTGFGSIDYLIENQFTGEFTIVHREHYANEYTAPNLLNSSLPLYIRAYNDGSAGDIIIKSSSQSAFVQGTIAELGERWGTLKTLGSVTTEKPILTIHPRAIFGSIRNRGQVLVNEIFFNVDGAVDAIFKVYLNTELVGTPSFSNINANSITEVDTASTGVTAAVGSLTYTTIVQKNSKKEKVYAPGYEIVLREDQILTITGTSLSGTSLSLTAGLNWTEEL